MYTNNATRKHPGLVVLMIDQSEFMDDISPVSGKTYAVIATENINCLLTEMVKIATRPIGDGDEEEVRDIQKVVVIGYGSEPENNASILYEGYLSEIDKKYKYEEIANVEGYSFHGYRVIEPVSGYCTPMASAFRLAKQAINEWKKCGRDGKEDPSPIIINFTGSAPTDAAGYPTEEALDETAKEAHEIMNIAFPDGSPRICNIQIGQLDGKEVHFPDNTNVIEGYPFAQFLYGVSSQMTDDLMEDTSACGHGNQTINSRMLLVGESSIYFIFLSKLVIPLRRDRYGRINDEYLY